MSALIHNRIFDTGETVEDNRTSASLDVVDGSLSKGEANGDGNGIFGDCAEDVGHIESLE